MYQSVLTVLAGMLVVSLFLPGPAGAGKQGQTSMKHSPPSYFVSGHRIQVEADVSDPAGIELVRCYFRAAGEVDFFIRVAEQGSTSYTLWQGPDGSTIRIDNPPATSDGSMSFSSYLEPGRTTAEGTWSVSFYYNDRKLYTDTFVVTSGSGVTVYWTY